MAYPAKTERNNKLFADYRGGMTGVELAKRYDLSVATVRNLLNRHGVTLPEVERLRRRKKAAATALRNGGRPAVWPDCPEHLHAEYMRLRRSYGIPARKARQLLEASS